MSLIMMKGYAGAVLTIKVAFLALEAIMKDQVEQLRSFLSIASRIPTAHNFTCD